MTDDKYGFTSLSEAAVGLHEMFVSLVSAGFTDDQAITLIVQMLHDPPSDPPGMGV
jgi:hypothetical protein